MGGLGTPSVITDPLKIGIVSMLVVMGAGFSLGWGCLTYVVTTELPALKLRDDTLRVGFIVNVAFKFVQVPSLSPPSRRQCWHILTTTPTNNSFAVNFSIPYLIYDRYAGLDSKVGFVFGSVAVICVVFTYFCVPECKGKTLEQVDYLFRERVPLRKFGSYEISNLALQQEEEELGNLRKEGPQAVQIDKNANEVQISSKKNSSAV